MLVLPHRVFGSIAGVILFGLCVRPPLAAQETTAPWPPAGTELPGTPGLVVPRIVSSPHPQYSTQAMRARIQGVVVMQVIVREDGAVGDVRVTQSLGYGLDEQAVWAVKQWRFSPGTKNGTPVPVLATVELAFSLHDLPPPMTLPNGFVASTDPSAPWHEDSVAAPGLTVHFAATEAWAVRKSPNPSQLVAMSNPSHTRTVVVGQPLTLGGPYVQPLPVAKMQNFFDQMKRVMTANGRPFEVLGAGQSPLGPSHWIWLETKLDSLEVPNAPAEINDQLRGLFDGAGVWLFTTGRGTHAISVTCMLLTTRGLSREMREQDAQSAAMEFASILQRIWLESGTEN